MGAISTHIDANDYHTKYNDPDGDVEVWSPVLHNEAGCSEVCRRRYNVLEEIVPARSKPAAMGKPRTLQYLGDWRRNHETHPKAGSTRRVA